MSKITQGIFGAISVFLGCGWVQLAPAGVTGFHRERAAAPDVTINRTAKTDRAASVSESARRTRTISIQLDDPAANSMLFRVPVALSVGQNRQVPAITWSDDQKAACEPVVSVLTEVSRQLSPGRCIT